MNLRRMMEITAVGDELLESLGVVPVNLAVQRYVPPETVPKNRFDAGFDDFTLQHCADWAPDEINILHAYCSASAGLAKKRRPRLVAYLDEKGGVRFDAENWQPGYYPPAPRLEQQARITDEQLLQEVGVW